MTRILMMVVVASLTLMGAYASAHDGPHGGPDEVTFKVGKNGEFNVRQDVKFGGVLVKRGKYVFEHKLDGERHLVVLTEAARKDGAAPVVYELPTSVLPARQVAKRTAMYAKEQHDRSLVVTIVEVTGERAEHLPQS